MVGSEARIPSLGTGGWSAKVEFVVEEGVEVGVDSSEHLDPRTDFMVQMCLSIFAVVTSTAALPPYSPTRRLTTYVHRFSAITTVYFEVCLPSKQTSPLWSFTHTLRWRYCLREVGQARPVGMCLNMGEKVYPHHSSVGRA